MITINKEFLKEVLTLQSESGKEKEQINPNIHSILRRINSQHKLSLKVEEDTVGNIYITKGKDFDLYPCIVAHTDNVGKYHNNKTIVEVNDILMAFNETGQVDAHGDDKIGLFCALQALIDLPRLKVGLFIDEERGCNGSRVALLDFFKNTYFILQSDRKGNSDWITYSNGVDICNQAFKDFVSPIMTPYGYKFERGILTDIGELVKRDVGVCTANISSGYYNPHSNSSYCKTSEVEVCYNLMIDVCKKGLELNKQFTYKYEAPVYTPKTFGKYSFRLNKLKEALYKEVKKRNKHIAPKSNSSYYMGMKDGLDIIVELLNDIDDEMMGLTKGEMFIDSFVDGVYDYIEEHNKPSTTIGKAICKGECSFMTDTSAIGGPEEVCINCGVVKGKDNKLPKQANLFDNDDVWEDYYKWQKQ